MIKFPATSASISLIWHGVLDHATNERFLSSKILQTPSQIHTQDIDVHLSFVWIISMHISSGRWRRGGCSQTTAHDRHSCSSLSRAHRGALATGPVSSGHRTGTAARVSAVRTAGAGHEHFAALNPAGRTQDPAGPVAMLQFRHWPDLQQNPGPVSLWPHGLPCEEGAEQGPAPAVGRG